MVSISANGIFGRSEDFVDFVEVDSLRTISSGMLELVKAIMHARGDIEAAGVQASINRLEEYRDGVPTPSIE
jgi:hypothetical protein